jgi:hypothetical protein
MNRKTYWQAYHHANRHRWQRTPAQRVKYAEQDKTYRRLNRTVIKVARDLGIPRAEARVRLGLPPWRYGQARPPSGGVL